MTPYKRKYISPYLRYISKIEELLCNGMPYWDVHEYMRKYFGIDYTYRYFKAFVNKHKLYRFVNYE